MADPRSLLPLHLALERHSIPEPNSGCWLWLGGLNNQGYGRIARGRFPNRRRLFAHRVAYELVHGPVAADAVIAHRCDNPACVNVEHLFQASQAENMADMRRKGRGKLPPVLLGEANPMAKLTSEQAGQIKLALRAGRKHREIAAEFGVSPATVSHISMGIKWREAEGRQ